MKIEPLDATLGARVTDVSLAQLAAGDWPAIEAAFHAHALLVFPGQHLERREQVAFASRFGAIEHLFGTSGIVPISNLGGDGQPLPDDSLPMQIMRGNEGWHTDSSYMPISARASVLQAKIVPEAGGQTAWADMRAAFDALDADMRSRISKLSAHHSIRHSQAVIGHTEADADASARRGGYGFDVQEPPLRPLVKPHPVTGRPALFIGRHAYGIPGLSPEDSETLLAELMDFACRPPRVYEHRWRPGDVAIWDNRCVLHRARPYDHSVPRLMLHTRIAGDERTEGAAIPA